MSHRLIDKAVIRWTKVVLALQIAKDASIRLIKRTMTPFAVNLAPVSDENHVLTYIQNQMDSKGRRCDQNCKLCVNISNRLRMEWKKRRKEVLIKCKETRTHLTKDDIWWSLCKIYTNSQHQQYIKDSAGPEDVDPQAILNLLMNCKLFDRRFEDELSTESRICELATMLNTYRNNTMHSSDNHLSEEEMNDAFLTIEYFIKEANNDVSNPRELMELTELKEQKEISEDRINKALKLKEENLRREIEEGKSAGKSVETYVTMLQHTTDYIDTITEIKKLNEELERLRQREKEKDKELEQLKKEKDEELELLKKEKDEELEQLQKEKDEELEQLKKERDEEVDLLKKETMDLKDEIYKLHLHEEVNKRINDVKVQRLEKKVKTLEEDVNKRQDLSEENIRRFLQKMDQSNWRQDLQGAERFREEMLCPFLRHFWIKKEALRLFQESIGCHNWRHVALEQENRSLQRQYEEERRERIRLQGMNRPRSPDRIVCSLS